MPYHSSPLAPVIILFITIGFTACKEDEKSLHTNDAKHTFTFGADLSYVNQILDFGGAYRKEGQVTDPYAIFKSYGTELIRFRLWHTPSWTKDIYGAHGAQMYSDLADVAKGIRRAREEGMAVLLDIHYSDTWADPGKQTAPLAWRNITDLPVLTDSVYQYTFNVLSYLGSEGLMPEIVQIGNEINCGMFFTEAGPDFPGCNACEGEWKHLGEVINSGIRAVRKVSESVNTDTKVALHVADPKNVEWWFDNILSNGDVTDFDIIGFSYYPLWHTTVPFDKIGETIGKFTHKYQKPVMILETAYPWTTESNDDYTNLFGSQPPVTGYPFTPRGQYDLMKALTQMVMEGGGAGLIYWAPGWITSSMKTQWGSGSSFENATFFDFEGNTLKGIDYMRHQYNR